MDLFRTIQELHAERKRLVELIQAVEEIQGYYASRLALQKTRRRRGRKSMGTAERQQVSLRMRKYWEMRRRTQENHSRAAVA